MDVGCSCHCRLFQTLNRRLWSCRNSVLKAKWNSVWFLQAFAAQGQNGGSLATWAKVPGGLNPFPHIHVCTRSHTQRPTLAPRRGVSDSCPCPSLRETGLPPSSHGWGHCRQGLTLVVCCPQGPVSPLCLYAGHTASWGQFCKTKSLPGELACVPGLVLGTEVASSSQESLAFCKSINVKPKGLRDQPHSWPGTWLVLVPRLGRPCFVGQEEKAEPRGFGAKTLTSPQPI